VDGDTLRKITICSHTFHEGCLESWFKYNEACPICSKPLDREILRIIRPKRDLSVIRRNSIGSLGLEPPTNSSKSKPKLGPSSILRERANIEGFEEKILTFWKMPSRHMSMSKSESPELSSPKMGPSNQDMNLKSRGAESRISRGVCKLESIRDMGVITTEGPQKESNHSQSQYIETDPGSVSIPLSDRIPMTSSIISNNSNLPFLQSPSSAAPKNATDMSHRRGVRAEKQILVKKAKH
jgi:RING-H2 zinc finger domain